MFGRRCVFELCERTDRQTDILITIARSNQGADGGDTNETSVDEATASWRCLLAELLQQPARRRHHASAGL